LSLFYLYISSLREINAFKASIKNFLSKDVHYFSSTNIAILKPFTKPLLPFRDAHTCLTVSLSITHLFSVKTNVDDQQRHLPRAREQAHFQNINLAILCEFTYFVILTQVL